MSPGNKFGGGRFGERRREIRGDSKCRILNRIWDTGGSNISSGPVKVSESRRRVEGGITAKKKGGETRERRKIIARDG